MTKKASLFNYRLASRLYDVVQHYYSEIPFRLFPEGRAFPVWHYYFEVTRRCNLRCKMCMFHDYMMSVPAAEQASGELTADEWKRVIDQTGHMSLITFTGGEPFVRQDFMEILAYASAHARTHVITNGTLLDESRVENLLEMTSKRPGGRGLFSIGVSLEGPEKHHDAICGLSGAFNRTMNGLHRVNALRNSRNLRFPMIHVTTVIQKDNLPLLPEMPRIVKEAGSDILNLTLEYRAMDQTDFDRSSIEAVRSRVPATPHLDSEELRRVLEETDANARALGINLRMPRMPREHVLDYYSGKLKPSDFSCRGPWNTLIVNKNGDVCSCWIFSVGNVKESSLKKMWNGENMRDLRRACREGLFPMCAGCCFLEYRGKTMKKDDRL